jgi:hypothetical protein
MLAMQVLWCVACQRALAWALMASAESPATLFELLYLFFPRTAMRLGYDNGCNWVSYGLNRDPTWMASLRAFVDDLHWPGHTDCAASFHAGERFPMLCRLLLPLWRLLLLLLLFLLPVQCEQNVAQPWKQPLNQVHVGLDACAWRS